VVAVFSPAFDDGEPEERGMTLFKKLIVPLRIELFRLALRMTGSHKDNAEDLLHDSFLKALQQIESLADEKNARAWMYKIMRNSYISSLRSSKKFKLIPGNEMDRVIDLIKHCNGTIKKVEVRRALENLDETFKKPVLLCDLYGFSYEEAAKEIGCPLGTLMSRLSRGREKLRKVLES